MGSSQECAPLFSPVPTSGKDGGTAASQPAHQGGRPVAAPTQREHGPRSPFLESFVQCPSQHHPCPHFLKGHTCHCSCPRVLQPWALCSPGHARVMWGVCPLSPSPGRTRLMGGMCPLSPSPSRTRLMGGVCPLSPSPGRTRFMGGVCPLSTFSPSLALAG